MPFRKVQSPLLLISLGTISAWTLIWKDLLLAGIDQLALTVFAVLLLCTSRLGSLTCFCFKLLPHLLLLLENIVYA